MCLLWEPGKVTDVENVSEESNGVQTNTTVADGADSSDYPFEHELGGL